MANRENTSVVCSIFFFFNFYPCVVMHWCSIAAVNKNNEVRSPSSEQSHKVQNGQKPNSITESIVEKAADNRAKEAKEVLKNVMVDMPCVSTIGNGPHGKRIEGFLYTYRKGEEVRIVCVCHGSFLSPAEFVKHAGGAEVEHPLKHIVVNPSPFL